MKSLDFLICGLEHSGTTLLSDLMRQIPGCDSGFECGVLLCDKPSDFPALKPFSDNILKGWEISASDLQACAAQLSFGDFYDKLYTLSGLFSHSSLPRLRFDKTPRYISSVEKISGRAPGVPTLAMIKDPAAIAWSDFKRSGKKMNEIFAWYDQWLQPKKQYMKSAYKGYQYCWSNPQKCLVIRLEDLCFSAAETLKKVDKIVDVEYSPLQFYFKNKRYAHTKGQSVSTAIAVEHLVSLPEKLLSDIAVEFREFEGWSYDFSQQ